MFLTYPIILIIVLSILIVFVNFPYYCITGRLLTHKKLWKFIQLWTVMIMPIGFIVIADIPQINDCCTGSAIFSPDHRITVYALIGLCILAFIISIYRKEILPPLSELIVNTFLCLAVFFNFILLKHFYVDSYDWILWVIGNLPIIFVLLIELTENQILLQNYIDQNEFEAAGIIGQVSLFILMLHPVLKLPILMILCFPILWMLSMSLVIFGQKPDSLIRAFTDTYKHGFSQLNHQCENVSCGGHFLCSVGANGHKAIVKPIRYGERNGNRIICNRQLLVSNAFEELIQEKFPRAHKVIRKNYNKVGNAVYQNYSIFNIKWISDIVYLLMKPLEIGFVLTLYLFDSKPENRIAAQYLNKTEREYLKSQNSI